MCDLNAQDKDSIVASLAEISTLTDRVNAHAASISESAYMDHDALAGVLAALRDRADAAQRWVANKPHEHAGH
jgi:hypothetical protein